MISQVSEFHEHLTQIFSFIERIVEVAFLFITKKRN